MATQLSARAQAWGTALVLSASEWLPVAMPSTRRPATVSTCALVVFAGLLEALTAVPWRRHSPALRGLTYDLASRITRLERRGRALARYAGRSHGGPSDRVEFVRQRLKKGIHPDAPIFAAARALVVAGALPASTTLLVVGPAFLEPTAHGYQGVLAAHLRLLLRANGNLARREAIGAALCAYLFPDEYLIQLKDGGPDQTRRSLELKRKAERVRIESCQVGPAEYLRRTLARLAETGSELSPHFQ